MTDAERVRAIIQDYAQDDFAIFPVRAVGLTREDEKD